MRDVKVRHFLYSEGIHNLMRVITATVKIDNDDDIRGGQKKEKL